MLLHKFCCCLKPLYKALFGLISTSRPIYRRILVWYRVKHILMRKLIQEKFTSAKHSGKALFIESVVQHLLVLDHWCRRWYSPQDCMLSVTLLVSNIFLLLIGIELDFTNPTSKGLTFLLRAP